MREKTQFWRCFITTLAAIALHSVCVQASFETDSRCNLELTIHCDGLNFLQGDEIPISFHVTNRGDAVFKYDDRQYDRGGRMEEFQLQAWDASGRAVPDPRADYEPPLSGGLSGVARQIANDQSFEKTIILNRWALMRRPGGYRVVGTYQYYVPDPWNDPQHWAEHRLYKRYRPVQVISKPIEIRVGPRNARQMGLYIRDLTGQIADPGDAQHLATPPAEADTFARLIYTCDPRIAPTLIDLLYKDKPANARFWATEGLYFYVPHTDEIRDLLVDSAMHRGLTPTIQMLLESYHCDEKVFAELIGRSLSSRDETQQHEAAAMTPRHPDDRYTPTLIEIATDPNHRGRYTAIAALARNRTDAGVAALRLLLNDRHERTRNYAARAIVTAYAEHPGKPQPPDRQYTEVLAAIVADGNDPLWPTAISETIRTSSILAMAALRTRLDDPNTSIPAVDANPALRTIRTLLQNLDAKSANAISRYVRRLCTPPPGRPLRPDDFPQQYQTATTTPHRLILDTVNKRRQMQQADTN